MVMVYTRPSRHAATMRQSTSNVPVTQMKMGTLASSTWQSLVVAAGSRMMIKRLSVPMTSDETASGSSEFLGIVLMHVAYVFVKRGKTDKAKHVWTAVGMGLSLLIVLASIPWPFRAAGRALFPGLGF